MPFFSCAAAILLAMMSTTTSAIRIGNRRQLKGNDNDPCDGQCENGSICKQGEANFSSHTTQEGGPLPILQQTHISNGYHCECPFGWTGVQCEIPYMTCSDSAHQCYHGGECIPGLIDYFGNEQLFCDCSKAFDESNNIPYVGKYCEHHAINSCDPDHLNNTHFCANGGQCNNGAIQDAPPCICQGNYDGPHCEFKKGSVPQCDLECQNGGQCVLGDTPTEDEVVMANFLDTSEDGTAVGLGVNRFKRCTCPPGFDGPRCETQKVQCGDGYCLHGSTCVSLPQSRQGNNSDSDYYCDCNNANTDDASYAGRYCQFEATSYCTKNASLNGHLFCVNQGTCKENVYLGCDCPPGFAGFSCELQISEIYGTSNDLPRATFNPSEDKDTSYDVSETHNAIIGNDNAKPGKPALDDHHEYPDPLYDDLEYVICDLDCLNNGTCRNGAKDHGDLSEIIQNIDYMNETHSENFEHCVCPPGFFGLRCEHEVEVCGEGEHYCLHGSQCVKNENDESHTCDCSVASTNRSSVSQVFVGRSCEHKTTDICTERDDIAPAKPLSFCVNGGTCIAEVTSQERHPGCDCPDGWDGLHCELKVALEEGTQSETEAVVESESMPSDEKERLQGSETPEPSPLVGIIFSANQQPDSKMAKLPIIVIIVSIVVVIAFLCIKKTRKKAVFLTGISANRKRWLHDDRDDSESSKSACSSRILDGPDPFPQRFKSSSNDHPALFNDMEPSDLTPEANAEPETRTYLSSEHEHQLLAVELT